MHQEFAKNMETITHGTGKLMLFAGDHKIEHLIKDFFGPHIDPEVKNPEHLFKIASRGNIGAFATHLGLISRYATTPAYKKINYIAKLNGKTNIIPTEKKDPVSSLLWDIDNVIELKKNSDINICGIGYTVYLGSMFESDMLQEAAQLVYNAHQHGLVAILWMYPRGKEVINDQDVQLIAGAAGVATSLGADFAKIIPPKANENQTSAQLLQIAKAIAGNTKIICSGGQATDPERFLKTVYEQLNIGNIDGTATGRNIYQNKLNDAIKMTKAISALVYENATYANALKILKK
ncbi:aldolase [Candidatus Dependentiae bacterium]|nr:aldolase [Candidatus Dependentiae bacterium]